MKPTAVTISTPTWHVSESFGRYAVELRRALVAEGVIVNTIGKDAPNKTFLPCLTNLRIGYPTGYDRFGELANMGITISLSTWESTRMHEEWIPILNKASAVVVPCRWNLEMYRENGITAPLYLMPHGISSVFQPVLRPERKVFRFLLIADRGHRKGWIEGMNGFIKAFGDRNDVELVIKSWSLEPGHILLNLSNANIRVINEDYSEAQIAELYGSCDCMIFATHGEGFGFPPREFAATGGMAVATAWGGTADDIDQWGFGIDYELVPAWPVNKNHWGCGEWADANIDHLASALAAIRNMPHSLRQDLGKAASANVRSIYRWKDNATQLLRIIDQAQEALQDANQQPA